MPLTPFQITVMRLLAANRSPQSHVAGGVVINRDSRSPRISDDLDIFHDVQGVALSSFLADCATLIAAGFTCTTDRELPDFCRAVVSLGSDSLRLEWARDSACRFLPAEADADFGWRLSDLDVAVNKALALGGRVAGRDISDLVWLDDSGFPLGMLTWAAPGKDPGFSPNSLLEEMRANAKSPSEAELKAIGLSYSPKELKRRWLELARVAETEIARAAESGLTPGCVYFDGANFTWGEGLFAHPGKFPAHEPVIGGAWPVIR